MSLDSEDDDVLEYDENKIRLTTLHNLGHNGREGVNGGMKRKNMKNETLKTEEIVIEV